MRLPPAFALAVLALLSGAGCSRPDDIGAGPVAPAREALPSLPEHWQAVANAAGPVDNGWIDAFDDPRLAALVAEAQRNNPDLQAAAAQFAAASAMARQARSGLLPSAQALASGSRSRIEIDEIDITGAEGLPIPSSLEYDSTSFIGLAQVSWELDLWGRIGDGWYAALENERAAEADYRAAQQSLAAGVARAYFLTIEANGQVALAEEAVATLDHLHRLVALQVAAGVAMERDLSLARASLAQARERHEQARGQHGQAIRALEVLVGRYPAADLDNGAVLPAMPPPPPAGIPSTLLERRPDLVAAERRVAAALHSEDEAAKARLPQLTLTGIAGAVSDALEDLLDPTATLLSAGGNIAAPIFQGGALAAGERLAEAGTRGAVAGYADTALAAFEEVETALDRGVVLRARRAAAAERLAEIEDAYRIEMLRYEVGESSLLDALQIRQQAVEARTGLLTIERELREQYVTLNLALGGPWSDDAGANAVNRPDPPDSAGPDPG